MKTNGTDRPIQKRLDFEADGSQIIAFKFWDRIKILFGFRVIINASFRSEFRPGAMKPLFIVCITPNRDLVAALADSKSIRTVAISSPVLDDLLQVQVERLREQTAKQSTAGKVGRN